MIPPIKKFTGFVPPEKNFFQMPNEWIDICSEIRDISELKVIQYILRHTWGFHEYGICKTISVDEFMQGRRRQDGSRMDKGTGLSEQSVRNGIKQAIEDGYLVCETDTSDAGRIKKSYTLKMRTAELEVQTFDPVQTLDPLNSRPQGTNPYTSDSQSLDPRVPEFRPRSEKDTKERHYKKDTKERQEREEVADATARSQSSQEISQDDEDTVTARSQDQSLQERVAEVFGQYLVLNGINLKVKLPADDETEKRKAVKPSQKEVVRGHHQHRASDNHLTAHSDLPDPVQPEHRKDTNRNTEPPHPRKPRSNPTIPKRPKQQGLMDEIPKPIPPEAIAIMDRWDSNHTKPSPRGEKTIKAAILLIPFNPTKEELKACEEWLFTTDRPGKPWYRSHGVHLPDIADKIGSWQSLQNAPPAKPEKEPSNEHKVVSQYSPKALYEKNKWKADEMIAEWEAKEAAKQGVQS